MQNKNTKIISVFFFNWLKKISQTIQLSGGDSCTSHSRDKLFLVKILNKNMFLRNNQNAKNIIIKMKFKRDKTFNS